MATQGEVTVSSCDVAELGFIIEWLSVQNWFAHEVRTRGMVCATEIHLRLPLGQLSDCAHLLRCYFMVKELM